MWCKFEFFHPRVALLSGRRPPPKLALSAVVLLTVVFLVQSVWAQPPGTFTRIASMSEARSYFSATLLLNGKVLIAGGVSTPGELNIPSSTSAAELIDPASNTFSETGGMDVPGATQSCPLLFHILGVGSGRGG